MKDPSDRCRNVRRLLQLRLAPTRTVRRLFAKFTTDTICNPRLIAHQILLFGQACINKTNYDVNRVSLTLTNTIALLLSPPRPSMPCITMLKTLLQTQTSNRLRAYHFQLAKSNKSDKRSIAVNNTQLISVHVYRAFAVECVAMQWEVEE